MTRLTLAGAERHLRALLRSGSVAVKTEAIVVVTPAWQGKTPFTWKVAGARLSAPEIGGVVIRQHDSGTVFTQTYVRPIGRSESVRYQPGGLAGGDPGSRAGKSATR